MRKMWFAAVGILTLLAAPWRPAAAASPALAPAAAPALLQLTPDDHILGNPQAPITIIEYASLSCPHCAHFADEVLPKLKKSWIDTGKAKLVMRDYPLDQPALRAAMIARCAPPDRFYTFVDAFFANQREWVLPSEAQVEAALTHLAELGGMSKSKVQSCLKDATLENKIVNSRLVASQKLGVDATPTFFINGSKFTGVPTAEEFDKVLSSVSTKS